MIQACKTREVRSLEWSSHGLLQVHVWGTAVPRRDSDSAAGAPAGKSTFTMVKSIMRINRPAARRTILSVIDHPRPVSAVLTLLSGRKGSRCTSFLRLDSTAPRVLHLLLLFVTEWLRGSCSRRHPRHPPPSHLACTCKGAPRCR